MLSLSLSSCRAPPRPWLLILAFRLISDITGTGTTIGVITRVTTLHTATGPIIIRTHGTGITGLTMAIITTLIGLIIDLMGTGAGKRFSSQ